jgi:GntR family transcriptional regulator/MocR family aminotransferase
LSRPVWNPSLAFALDPTSREPLFVQLARAITEDIRRGRLAPGARLPGSRMLARTLSVHRNTVVAAYAELLAEGWLDSAQARGTFVSRALPELSPRRFSGRMAQRQVVPARAGFEVPSGPDRSDLRELPRGALVMSGGIPDVRLAPSAELARAYRRALRAHAQQVLGYSTPEGHPRLRAAIAEMLSATRGLATSAEDVIVTRGAQMALDLIARTLLRPGDGVAVEQLGYRPAWESFRLAGARLHPVPVDASGLDVAALEALVVRTRIRAVYVTPHHQYPTTVTLSPARRLALMELARRHHLAILEDDFDHEFHFEGRPVLPLASVDHAGVVVYIGTMAKILAPGLRLGYVAAPRELLLQLAAHRAFVDRQGDLAVECAVAELLEDGEVQRHARRARRIYAARRAFLVDALQRSLGGVLSLRVPPGGMALWSDVAEDVDVEAWSCRAASQGVVFHAGRRFSFADEPCPNARFGFTSLTEGELREGVRRLEATLGASSGFRRSRRARSS